MELFEEVKNSNYVWKLFYLLNGIPSNGDDKKIIQNVDNIEIMKLCTTGIGVNIADEEKLLTKCKHIRIFTREIELALLSGDKEMYLYLGEDGEFPPIHQLGIVGKYIYIGDKEVASPVYIRTQETYTDSYFLSFREYVTKNETQADIFHMKYENNTFIMTYQDEDMEEPEEIMSLKNADIGLTYPFVLYTLIRLAERHPDTSFENGFIVNKIKRKE